MIEVDLKINGSTVFEYYTSVVPVVGEYIDISHDNISGNFKVNKVTHRVFQSRKDKKVVSYVIVEAE